MKEHSEEVKQLRRNLLDSIQKIDFENLSVVDHIYLYCLVIFSEMHLRETDSVGDEVEQTGGDEN